MDEKKDEQDDGKNVENEADDDDDNDEDDENGGDEDENDDDEENGGDEDESDEDEEEEDFLHFSFLYHLHPRVAIRRCWRGGVVLRTEGGCRRRCKSCRTLATLPSCSGGC